VSRINWFRTLSVTAVFAVIWQISPEFLKGAAIGYTFMLLCIKFEQHEVIVLEPPAKKKRKPLK